MKKGYLYKLSALAALSGLLATSTQAADYSATATALVVSPLTISEDVTMDFGSISGGATAGTVVLAPDGTRSVTGGAQALSVIAGAAGRFTVSGEPGFAYTVSFTNGVLADGAGVGAPMAVGTFVQNAGFSGTLSGAGTDVFTLGATLQVGVNQTAGSYSTATGGTPYTVTFNYN